MEREASALNGYLEDYADALYQQRFGTLEDNAVLADVADITMGQSPVGTSYNEDGIGVVFYQGRAEFGWRYPKQRLHTTEPKRMAKAGDVLMSVRAPVGDLNLAYEDCCIGRGLAAIHCEHPSFALYLMRSLHKKLDAYNGECTVFGSINGKALKELPIALPENAAMMAFEKEVMPIDAQIRSNEAETRSLAILRDTLLPKLMSGEIGVSEVDLTQLNSHLAALWSCGRRSRRLSWVSVVTDANDMSNPGHRVTLTADQFAGANPMAGDGATAALRLGRRHRRGLLGLAYVQLL